MKQMTRRYAYLVKKQTGKFPLDRDGKEIVPKPLGEKKVEAEPVKSHNPLDSVFGKMIDKGQGPDKLDELVNAVQALKTDKKPQINDEQFQNMMDKLDSISKLIKSIPKPTEWTDLRMIPTRTESGWIEHVDIKRKTKS